MSELPLDAVTTEYWFHRQLESYGLLAPLLPVGLLKQVLQKHLSARYRRYMPRVFEPENSQMWLSFILKVNEIIKLERSSTKVIQNERHPNTTQIIRGADRYPQEGAARFEQVFPTSDKDEVLVAVSPLASDREIQSNLDLISSEQFSAARHELGITKHWLVVLPGYPLVAPNRSELMERFQNHLKLEPECGVIQFPNQPHNSPCSNKTFYMQNLLNNPLPWEQEHLVNR